MREGGSAVENWLVPVWDVYSATSGNAVCLLHFQCGGGEFKAGCLIYGLCCVLYMRIQWVGMWGSGKLDTLNIRDGFWKIRHWMYNLGSSFVSPGVVHLKFLFQSLKASKSAEKCIISNCLFKNEKIMKWIERIFTFIAKQAIFRFQTKPLPFFSSQ